MVSLQPKFPLYWVLFLLINLAAPCNAQDTSRTAKQIFSLIQSLQIEETDDAVALNKALAEESSSKQREALGIAYAIRNSERATKILVALQKLDALQAPPSKLSMEERISINASDELKTSIRERYTLIDQIAALEEETKEMTASQRSETYQEWFKAKGSELAKVTQEITKEIDHQTPLERNSIAPKSPENFSSEEKVIWDKRNQMQAELISLKESTKNLTPTARCKVYQDWFQMNAVAMEDIQNKINLAAEASIVKSLR